MVLKVIEYLKKIIKISTCNYSIHWKVYYADTLIIQQKLFNTIIINDNTAYSLVIVN